MTFTKKIKFALKFILNDLKNQKLTIKYRKNELVVKKLNEHQNIKHKNGK